MANGLQQREQKGILRRNQPFEIQLSIEGPEGERSIFHYECIPQGPSAGPDELPPGPHSYGGDAPPAGVLQIDLAVASNSTASLKVSQKKVRADESKLKGDVKWDFIIG